MDDLIAAVKEMHQAQGDDREISRVFVTDFAITGSITTTPYNDDEGNERLQIVISYDDWDKMLLKLPLKVERKSPLLFYGIPVVYG